MLRPRASQRQSRQAFTPQPCASAGGPRKNRAKVPRGVAPRRARLPLGARKSSHPRKFIASEAARYQPPGVSADGLTLVPSVGISVAVGLHFAILAQPQGAGPCRKCAVGIRPSCSYAALRPRVGRGIRRAVGPPTPARARPAPRKSPRLRSCSGPARWCRASAHRGPAAAGPPLRAWCRTRSGYASRRAWSAPPPVCTGRRRCRPPSHGVALPLLAGARAAASPARGGLAATGG